MKKFFRKVHLWLSVPFGLIMAITCFTGALLVFEDEITRFSNRELYFVKDASGVPMPIDELAATVAAALPEDVTVTGVTVFENPQRAWQVNISKPRRAAVMVDQYTGEIKGTAGRTPFFVTVFRLHRWLMDSMQPGGGMFLGKALVGISTLMFVFVLVSGVVIWAPRTYKALKNSLKIHVRKGWFPFWHGLHVAGGVYAVLLLLALALTGLTWSFQWYRNGFYKVFGVETAGGGGNGGQQQMRNGNGNGNGHGGSEAAEHVAAEAFGGWQQAYEEVLRRNPEFRQISVSDGRVSVSSGCVGNSRAADTYTFDSTTGQITDVALYRDSGKNGKIRGWIYSVHVGSWGGMVTRVLTFLAALLGACLPLTGYYIWIRRLVMRRRARVGMTANR